MADTPTQAERDQALAGAFAALAKGASPATSAPATQKFLVRWNDDKNRKDPDTGEVVGPGYDFYKNENYQEPKPTAPTSVSGSQYGTFGPDPNNPGGPWIPLVPPQPGAPSNPDEDISKAVKAQMDQADRNARIRNEGATGYYVTDSERATIENNLRQRGLDQERINLEIQKFGQQRKDEDRKAAIEEAKLPGTIAQTTATTAKIGAETDLTRAQIVALGIKTDVDADRAKAAGLLDAAQTEKIKAELKKPEPVTTPAEQQFLVQRDPVTGKQIVEINPNYAPKAPVSRGEIAQRTAQLQSQIVQMRDKIQADKSIPPDQQSARFNSWYDQNVAPQITALDQQQQAVMADEAQKAVEFQQKNLTAAANAIQSTAPYRVGPGYGQAFESLVQATANTSFPGAENKPINLGTGWSTWKGPSIDESTQQVLNARTEVQPGMDLQSLLGRGQWTPGGPAAGPATAAGSPATGPTNLAVAPIPGLAPGGLAQGGGANAGLIPPWQRADQAQGSAPPGNLMAGPGVAGAVPPGSPQYLGSMPQPGPAMPMATGSGPLPYNPTAFSGVMPLLPGFDYSKVGTQYQWPT